MCLDASFSAKGTDLSKSQVGIRSGWLINSSWPIVIEFPNIWGSPGCFLCKSSACELQWLISVKVSETISTQPPIPIQVDINMCI
jgi:hypothetical protein